MFKYFTLLLALTMLASAVRASEGNEPDPARLAAILALGKKGDDASKAELLKLLQAPATPQAERDAALRALPFSKAGGEALLALADAGQIPDELKPSLSMALAASPVPEIKAAGEQKYPQPRFKDGTLVPLMDEMATLKGDAAKGAKIFRSGTGPNCVSCHMVGEEGKPIGPPLNVIGDKLSKLQFYEAIMLPSASILMGYEQWIVKVKGSAPQVGRLTEDTDDHITILTPVGEYVDIPVANVAKKTKLPNSLMPEGLVKTMTKQEMVDLVEYLTTLKN